MTDKEKPDVLSDEELDKAWPSATSNGQALYPLSFEMITMELLRCAKAIAQAQRDADVAYYEPIIQQMLQDMTKIKKDIDDSISAIDNAKQLIQQAKEEVARDIFEWLDNHRYPATFDAWQSKCWGVSDADLEEGRAKFIK
jgi:hypothetical protein